MDFHSQIASIMEVLANAAVAEICKVVDDGYSVVHLEMSQSQKENEFLRRKIKLLELQVSRYRAERMKGTDGSTGSRFPGVRLLNRQHRDTPTGPSLQGRTRFLNRVPAANQSLPKSQPTNLDQDPDQEVVTTTKIESAEPEDEGKGELVIVKVEGAVEIRDTDQRTPVEGSITARGNSVTSPPGGLEDFGDAQPARHRSETEGHTQNPTGHTQKMTDHIHNLTGHTHNLAGHTHNLTGLSSPHNKEQSLYETQEDSISVELQEKNSHSRTLQERPESSDNEHTGRPSCSTYPLYQETIPGSSSSSSSSSSAAAFSQIRADLPSNFPSLPEIPKSHDDQESTESNCDVIVIDSLPDEMESCDVELSWIRGGDEDSGLNGGGSKGARGGGHAPPLPGIPATGRQNAPNELMFSANGAYSERPPTFTRPPVAPAVAMGTVEPQQHQATPLWSGVQRRPHAPLLPHLGANHTPSTNQDQSSQPLPNQIQEPVELLLPHSCLFCGRRYAHLCQLRIHQRVHTGEKPYQCVQCGKSFGQFCSLKRHRMVHTGEKPYHCTQCGKQFSTANNLKVHQSVHTGEKKFHCSQCGKNFSFLSNLIRHQAIHAAK